MRYFHLQQESKQLNFRSAVRCAVVLLIAFLFSACSNPYQTLMTPELLSRVVDQSDASENEKHICPDLEARSSEAYVGLYRLDDDESLDKETFAGGRADLERCHGYEGFSSIKPDIAVNYTGISSDNLTIEIQSGVDTTVLVKTPSGDLLFDDDNGEGTNGRVFVADPETGEYLIWVGSFKEDDAYEAYVTILISTS